MRKLIIGFLLCIVLSCNRSAKSQVDEAAPVPVTQPQVVQLTQTAAGASPQAILQTGEHPIWFQLTEEGPLFLETIEDTLFSAAFVPWPLALHVRFFLEKGDELIMLINRDGFLKLAPYSEMVTGLALYRFHGGEFWRQYTAGGFVFYKDEPAALLYLDDHFLDSDALLPQPRTWTFDMKSNTPFPLDIPALEFFPVKEGWNVDTLRLGSDGFWYYRVSRSAGQQGEVRMLRTDDLAHIGEDVSQDAFYHSAPQETELPGSFSLPPLPEGFFYTGIAMAGGSLFASWEEQKDFNIGAAGFVLLKAGN